MVRRGYTRFENIGTFQLFMWFISTGKTMIYQEHYLVLCKLRLATNNMGEVVLKGAPLTFLETLGIKSGTLLS